MFGGETLTSKILTHILLVLFWLVGVFMIIGYLVASIWKGVGILHQLVVIEKFNIIALLVFGIALFFVTIYESKTYYSRRWTRIAQGKCPNCGSPTTGTLSALRCPRGCYIKSETIASVDGLCSFCGGELKEQEYVQKATGAFGERTFYWRAITCLNCLRYTSKPAITIDGKCSECGGELKEAAYKRYPRTSFQDWIKDVCQDCGKDSNHRLVSSTPCIPGGGGYDFDWRP